MINDVSAFRAEPEMAGLVAERGADCCLMHMLGEPRTMQEDPRYEDVVDDVRAFLEERLEFAVREGVAQERIMLDPGIGFGKTRAQPRAAAAAGGAAHAGRADRDRDLAQGLPRPSSLAGGRGGAREASQRLAGTIATNVLAYERGASVFRVHDVAPVRDALAVAAATLGGRWTARSTGTTPAS